MALSAYTWIGCDHPYSPQSPVCSPADTIRSRPLSKLMILEGDLVGLRIATCFLYMSFPQ